MSETELLEQAAAKRASYRFVRASILNQISFSVFVYLEIILILNRSFKIRLAMTNVKLVRLIFFDYFSFLGDPMKQRILFLLFLTSFLIAGEASSVAAPVRPQPIMEDITLNDSALSAEIFKALDVKPAPYGLRRYSRGSSTVLKVDNGLICVKETPMSGRDPQPAYSCTILVGRGWVFEGPDSYRLVGNNPLAYRIFEILKVSHRKSGNMFIKSIRPKGTQGSTGSLFSCAIPNSTGEELGDSAICRLRDWP